MTRLGSIADLSRLPGPTVLAIGVFDGVHLGHRAVLGRAIESANARGGTAVAVTFDPHPVSVLRPGVPVELLTPTPRKLQLIGTLGIRVSLVIRFDHAFADTPPGTFLEELHSSAPALGEIVVGCGWTFGKGRSGTVDYMRARGSELGFVATEIPSVRAAGALVSSTRIRAAIRSGHLDVAAELLGRQHELRGTVLRGNQVGRKIGFPTANISSRGLVLPPDGVYAARAEFGASEMPCVANIGVRPTLGAGGERTVEAHIPGFSGDLYGTEIALSKFRFLRPEQKFDSLEALRKQIAADAVLALSAGQ